MVAPEAVVHSNGVWPLRLFQVLAGSFFLVDGVWLRLSLPCLVVDGGCRLIERDVRDVQDSGQDQVLVISPLLLVCETELGKE